MTGAAPQIDLKLQFCMEPWKSIRYPKINTRELESVKNLYDSNLKRVYSLTAFPPTIVNITRQFSTAAETLQVIYQMTLRPE